jgi:hypothetical protein
VWANRVDGLAAYGISLWRGKCDRIVGDTIGGLFSVEPFVQCIDESGEGIPGDRIERDLTFLATQAGVQEAFARAIFMSANCNLGAWYVRTKAADGKVVGFESDWIDARHFFVYPSNARKMADVKTHGHRFYLRLEEVQRLQKAKVWFKGNVSGGADPDEQTHLEGQFDKSTGPDEAKAEDGWVELFELITTLSDGSRVFCVIARDTQLLLDVQEWNDEYEPSWYSIVRLLRTEKRVYGSDSVAGGIQGLCLAHADGFNATMAGLYFSAYPLLVRTGYVGPAAENYEPGQIMDVDEGVTVNAIPIQFNLQGFLAALDKIEVLVDQTIGVSRLATSGAVNANTKATAIQAMLASDQNRQAGYQDAAAESLEEGMRALHSLYRVHYADLKEAFGNALEATEEDLARPMRIVASGRSVGDPNAILQKLMAFMELAQNPASPWDVTKVLQRVASAFGLPFDPTGLEKDEFTMLRDLSTTLAQQGINATEVLAAAAQAIEAQGQQPNGELSPLGADVPDQGMAAPVLGFGGEEANDPLGTFPGEDLGGGPEMSGPFA